jgi:rhamnogalacturonyl hydrolase YesR
MNLDLYKLCATLLLGAALPAAMPAAERPDPRAVRQLVTRVADWQIETFDRAAEYRAISLDRLKTRYTDHFREPSNHHELDWTNGVLYAGMNQFRAIAENKRKYTDWLVEIGDRNKWRTWYRLYYADDHTVAQTWLALYEDLGDPAMMEPVNRVFQRILRYPKTGSMEYVRREDAWIFETDVLNRWGWCDALFMAPPVWARLAKIRDDDRFLEFMDQEWRATYDLLWNETENFFARDTRFIDRTEENGRPLFWSRGNGWVLSGLALTIPHLPDDWEGRPFYIDVFRDMAGAVKNAQRADGTWSMGLLADPAAYPLPESSGTALFTHGLAWGINQGYLERAVYEPVVLKAWAALQDFVDAEGIFGYVQPIGAEPGESFPHKTEVYAVGAFLLAGTEVYRMLGGAE